MNDEEEEEENLLGFITVDEARLTPVDNNVSFYEPDEIENVNTQSSSSDNDDDLEPVGNPPTDIPTAKCSKCESDRQSTCASIENNISEESVDNIPVGNESPAAVNLDFESDFAADEEPHVFINDTNDSKETVVNIRGKLADNFYLCPTKDCLFSTSNRSVYHDHLTDCRRLYHSYPCMYCGSDISFDDAAILIFHIEDYHQNRRNIFKCPLDRFATSDLDVLAVHLRCHGAFPHVECYQCRTTFASAADLLDHYAQSFERTFFCALCDFTTTEENNVGLHFTDAHPTESHSYSETASLLCYPSNQIDSSSCNAQLLLINRHLDSCLKYSNKPLSDRESDSGLSFRFRNASGQTTSTPKRSSSSQVNDRCFSPSYHMELEGDGSQDEAISVARSDASVVGSASHNATLSTTPTLSDEDIEDDVASQISTISLSDTEEDITTSVQTACADMVRSRDEKSIESDSCDEEGNAVDVVVENVSIRRFDHNSSSEKSGESEKDEEKQSRSNGDSSHEPIVQPEIDRDVVNSSVPDDASISASSDRSIVEKDDCYIVEGQEEEESRPGDRNAVNSSVPDDASISSSSNRRLMDEDEDCYIVEGQEEEQRRPDEAPPSSATVFDSEEDVSVEVTCVPQDTSISPSSSRSSPRIKIVRRSYLEEDEDEKNSEEEYQESDADYYCETVVDSDDDDASSILYGDDSSTASSGYGPPFRRVIVVPSEIDEEENEASEGQGSDADSFSETLVGSDDDASSISCGGDSPSASSGYGPPFRRVIVVPSEIDEEENEASERNEEDPESERDSLTVVDSEDVCASPISCDDDSSSASSGYGPPFRRVIVALSEIDGKENDEVSGVTTPSSETSLSWVDPGNDVGPVSSDLQNRTKRAKMIWNQISRCRRRGVKRFRCARDSECSFGITRSAHLQRKHVFDKHIRSRYLVCKNCSFRCREDRKSVARRHKQRLGHSLRAKRGYYSSKKIALVRDCNILDFRTISIPHIPKYKCAEPGCGFTCRHRSSMVIRRHVYNTHGVAFVKKFLPNGCISFRVTLPSLH